MKSTIAALERKTKNKENISDLEQNHDYLKDSNFEKERFVIDDFHNFTPFASFLPGIAGLKGIPLWCFYTNRGQGITSFGREGKEKPILEFRPADQAYRDVSSMGFRTFLRFPNGQMYEPFAQKSGEVIGKRQMSIGKADIILTDETSTISTEVQYAILQDEKFPALIRKVKFTNKGTKHLKLDALDGLPRIVPNGICDQFMKVMSTTASAWIETDISFPEMPSYKIRASIEDSLSVSMINGANFMISGISDFHGDHILKPIVDPIAIFGSDYSFTQPEVFMHSGLEGVLEKDPVLLGRYPCGFSGFQIELEPGESCSLQTLLGFSDNPVSLHHRVYDFTGKQWINEKIKESRQFVDKLVKPVSMKSGFPDLDKYTAFTGLDNILRGGFPIVWNKEKNPKTYHVFSRKHGDMERDYNSFNLPSQPFSAGLGNFRDINQNRRTDVVFNPSTGDSGIFLFMSLIQTDGYNPLIVKPAFFRLKESSVHEISKRYSFLEEWASTDDYRGFTPGDLFKKLNQNTAEYDLSVILNHSEFIPQAEFGEGYWVDHWTYNLDLIDQYLRIFPDKEKELFFGERKYLWYKSPVTIRPFKQRFKMEEGEIVKLDHLIHGESFTESFEKEKSTLLEKLLFLALIKSATLDLNETGIEMEAGRPGWYDALNGLPTLFGSSLSDSCELLRLLELLISLYDRFGDCDLLLFKPVITMADSLEKSLDEEDQFLRWKKRWEIRDVYRLAINKKNIECEYSKFSEFYDLIQTVKSKLSEKLNLASYHNGGILPTYFRYTPETWVNLENGYIIPGKMQRKILPLFLEGAVKQMKAANSKEIAQELFNKVKESVLFDKKLKMYRLNDTLNLESPEIGRAMAFPDGWLENGSIWLHMEYKYLLEILKSELGSTFWKEAENCLIPFLDPEVYGRSIYENSSFIVSSSYPEKSVHGKGYIARLSGATAEYLTMWTYFLMGSNPFFMEKDELVFQPVPIIPATLFQSDGTLEWTLFGTTRVVYKNPEKRDLLINSECKPLRMELFQHGQKEVFSQNIRGEYAQNLRGGKFDKLIVFF